jgi:hypothetical protein
VTSIPVLSSSSPFLHAPPLSPTRPTRARSAGNVTRLTMLERRKSDLEIHTLLKNVAVASRIRVTWWDSSARGATSTISQGTVVGITVKGVTMVYDGIDGSHPLPPIDPDIVILDIRTISGHAIGTLPPLTLNRRMDTDPAAMVYVAAATTPNPGPGVAALYMDMRGDPSGSATSTSTLTSTSSSSSSSTSSSAAAAAAATSIVVSHAKFYPYATLAWVEWSATLAGLRLARATPAVELIVVQSMPVFLGLSGSAPISGKAKALATEARALYGELCGRVSIGHMADAQSNPAKGVIRESRLKQSTIGDAALFVDSSHVRPTPLAARIEVDVDTSSRGVTIATLHDFISLKYVSTRDRCPPSCVGRWASVVKCATSRVVLASSAEERNSRMLTLLTLPHQYLLRSVATRRLEGHLRDGKPFTLSSRSVPNTEQSQSVRLARAVTRLAEDFKMRTAVKLIQNTAEGKDDMPYEDKVAALRSKFIDPVEPRVTAPIAAVSPFDASAVSRAIARQSKQAAAALDGWTRELLVQATHADPSILDDIAVIAQCVVERQFGALVMDCLKAGRLVGIPKNDGGGGVRPIVISSIWPKIIGTMCLERSGTKCSPFQYATGKREGAAEILHCLRAAIKAKMVIVKFDISNAFNETKRSVVRNAIADDDISIRAYFESICEGPSTLAVFGPKRSYETIEMCEGMRQGDAPSSLLFCKALDPCLRALADSGLTKIYAYMDDLQVVCDKEELEDVVGRCVKAITAQGFRVNLQKSKILAQNEDDDMAPMELPVVRLGDGTPFTVLGSDLNESQTFMTEYVRKVTLWFKKLHDIDLHPCLKFTVLRICGAPKIKYACETMRSEYTKPLTKAFDEECVKCLQDIVGFMPTRALMHDVSGAGLPDYVTHADALFARKSDAVMTGAANTLQVQLVSNHLASADLEGTHPEDTSQANTTGRRYHQGEYLFHRRNAMSPMEFIVALAMRLNGIPRELDLLPTTCGCGVPIRTSNDMQEHLTRCEMSAVSATYRHELVKMAMAGAAREYGITVTTEPTFYTYGSGVARRPDLVFWTELGHYTTDVTIVLKEKKVGDAAAKADKEKTDIHAAAVSAMGHKFIPAACESHGFMGPNVYALARALAKAVPQYLATWFYSNFVFRVSCALAKGRVATFMHICRQMESISSSASARRSVYCLDYRNIGNSKKNRSQLSDIEVGLLTSPGQARSTVSVSSPHRARPASPPRDHTDGRVTP